MNRTVWIAIGLTALAGLPAHSARADFCGTDVCVRFVPQSQSVPLNAVTFNVDIVADITTPLLGWGGDVLLSTPGIVTEAAAPVIGGAWIAAAAADGDGLAGIAFPNAVVGENILLATLTLSPSSVGATNISFAVTPGDLTEGFPRDPTGFAAFTVAPGSITVTPEPATLGLLLAGAALRKRRRASQTPPRLANAAAPRKRRR